MPLPQPRDSEDRAKFMERCMKLDEYPQKQRVAICLKQWGDKPVSALKKARKK